jgi:hypothetical protein
MSKTAEAPPTLAEIQQRYFGRAASVAPTLNDVGKAYGQPFEVWDEKRQQWRKKFPFLGWRADVGGLRFMLSAKYGTYSVSRAASVDGEPRIPVRSGMTLNELRRRWTALAEMALVGIELAQATE